MAVIDLREFDGAFVVHYGGQPSQVDAFTFANSLIEIAEAVRAINARVSPELAIEISIDALGSGSFRARLKSTAKWLLGSAKAATPTLLIGLLVNFIYDKLTDDSDINIEVNDDSYVIQRGDDRIILSREVYERKKEIDGDAEIERRISRVFEVLSEDASVTEFGITQNLDDPRSAIEVPREKFAELSRPRGPLIEADNGKRFVDKDADLRVIRAIFERGSRKWQFAWNSVRISAPVQDATFFDRLEAGEIALSSGDILHVVLRVHQTFNRAAGVFLDDYYEVINVISHEKAPRQRGFRLLSL